MMPRVNHPGLALLAFACLSGSLAAQQAPANTTTTEPPPKKSPVTTTTASETREDGTVILNPFVVNSDSETGYQARSTILGSRLNTSTSGSPS